MTNLFFVLDIRCASTESHDTWVPGFSYCLWRNWLTRIQNNLSLPGSVIIQSDGGSQNWYLAGKTKAFMDNVYFKDIINEYEHQLSNYSSQKLILEKQIKKIDNQHNKATRKGDTESCVSLLKSRKLIVNNISKLKCPQYPLPLLTVCNNM